MGRDRRAPWRRPIGPVLALVLVLALQASADAANFVVTRLDDPVPDTCVVGDCSLREAVIAANLTAAVADTIALGAGTHELTRVNATADTPAVNDLDVTAPVTITGAGAATTTIDANAIDKVFSAQLVSAGLLQLTGVKITGGDLSGIENGGATNLSLTDSAVVGNTNPNGQGGGIDSNTGGSLTLTRTTVSGNSGANGGGIWVAVDATFTNSTISGNTATSEGGGILNESGTSTLTNTTVASNTGPANLGGGLVNYGVTELRNTIVSGNTGGNCEDTFSLPTSVGNNLESTDTCGLSQPTDKKNVDPLLGPLQNAGGQTDTRPLLAGSPAIDAGGASGCPATDQRGVTRPQGLGCDIGAFEVLVVPDTVIVAGPSVVTQDRTPTFTFSSTEPGTTFECSVDNSPFVACTSPFSVPELRAGRHTFAVRARDAAGNVDPSPASFTFVIPAKLSDLPAPVLGRTVNAEPVSGTVLVAVPGGAGSSRRGGARASQKGLKFVPLQEARQIPVGSFFNTSKGRVRLQSATSRRGKRQAGVFSGGLFQTLQSGKKSAGAVFELRLKGSSFKSCAAKKKASVSRRSKRRVRRLSGNAKGRFRTRGRYSAATVRGTIWTVTDRCDGTLTQVRSGQVTVRDLRRHKNIRLRRGKSYLARAPG